MTSESTELTNPEEEKNDAVLPPVYEYSEDTDDVNAILVQLTATRNGLFNEFSRLEEASRRSRGGAGLLLKLAEQIQMNASASVAAIKTRNSFKKNDADLKLKIRQQIANEEKDQSNMAMSAELLKIIQENTGSNNSPRLVEDVLDENSEDEADNLIEASLASSVEDAVIVENPSSNDEVVKEDTPEEDNDSSNVEYMAAQTGRIYIYDNDNDVIIPYMHPETGEHVEEEVVIDESNNRYIVFLNNETPVLVYSIDETPFYPDES